MKPEIRKRLELCNNLPSLPAAAMRIVELAKDPNAGMREVAEVVRKDPALSAKLLRLANSPLYARSRTCETFQQALVRLGLNATLSLALTFSLVSELRRDEGLGLDYPRVWRRSLIAATAARVLGLHFGLKDVEDLFLAALLQDIGMLALDRGYPELYSALASNEQEHDRIRTLERSHLGMDHGEVGQWLLRRWKLPERLCELVGASHETASPSPPEPDSRAQQAVALSGPIADLWMCADPELSLTTVQMRALQVQGLAGERLMGVLRDVADEAPEIEHLFEIELLDGQRSQWVLDEARETLMLRNLQMVQDSTQLRQVAASLREQAMAIEEKSKRDNLTGAFNRGFLDSALVEWFDEANRSGSPMTAVFVDLDDFKKVNDAHGHHVGDAVLARFAAAMHDVARASDLVARYGGEEFVVLLRECGSAGARRFCERLLEKCRAIDHELESGGSLKVTASMGAATHGERVVFSTSLEMVRAADEALYKAKQSGKDCWVEHNVRADAA